MRLRPPHFAAAAALVGVLALAGCAAEPAPGPDTGRQTASPTAEPSLVPGGTAEQNKPWFDHVNQITLAQNAKASSREMVDALVVAGFDKTAMEVTFDSTSAGYDADYIIVSVRIGEECLIGQRSGRGYHSEIVPPVASTGTCLIGETRPIDG
ncbi:MAG: hypothetical protein Q4E05_08555 [Pseudoclavibacter sp.]|nr:hypothetical protein [Pseudoclavibacter sp.]